MSELTGLYKILSVIMSAIVSLFSSFIPAKNMKIETTPAVFDCGNEYYNIVWETSKKGSGYIKLTVDGEEKIYYDDNSGIIQSDDTVHNVLVPKSELTGNTYIAGSQYVGFKYGYDAIKGKTVETTPISFRGIPKEDGIKILSISDIHEMEAEMYKSLSHFKDSPDILVLLGDIISTLETKDQFTDYLLKDAGDISKGEIPIIYTRGNHETRGEYASRLKDYFPCETGEFYYTFEFGALSGIVLDSGEDKDDSHEEYNGLVNFEAYRNREYEWLKSLKADEFTGRYKIAFCHDPAIDNIFGQNWMAALSDLGMDLLVSGHWHTYSFYEKEIPVFIDCGEYSGGWAASMLTLENDTVNMLTINTEGEILLNETMNVK